MPQPDLAAHHVAHAVQGIYAVLEAAKGRPASRRIADGTLSLDPASTSPFPSGNRNRVDFLGCSAVVPAAAIELIITTYRGAGVATCFVWLSPSQRAGEIAALLLDHGFTRFSGSSYPTLVHSAVPQRRVRALPETTLVPRLVTAAQAAAAHAELVTIYGTTAQADEFVGGAGKPGMHHFLAYDGQTPVAAAVLAVSGQTGYLGDAATAEAHRERGAQNRLIAARVAHAASLGCTTVVAETLSRLKASLRNLQRQGFATAFERQVFRWTAG